MADRDLEKQNDFMIEKIKQRPIDRGKLLRRTLITASMAVIFGLIACVTFLVLEPVISNWLYPEEESQIVVFPEDQKEMSPEEMLAENLPAESPEPAATPSEENEALEEQIFQIISQTGLEMDRYDLFNRALHDYLYVPESTDETVSISQYIVTVKGLTSNVDWFDNVQESSDQTTGVIIYNNDWQDVLILADYTPLKEAQNLVIELSDSDDQVPVSLRGLDPVTGLAVLSVEGAIPAEWRETYGLRAAPMGSLIFHNADMVGQPVVAVGSPMGVSNSMGYGMITAYACLNDKPDLEAALIQTDIYGSNNANGFLFDLYHNLIGVITTKESVSGMENMITAYGIPDLMGRIQKLSNQEEIPYIGISGVSVPWKVQQDQGVPRGVYITQVEMDSPAMLAGIQPGDVLTMIDETLTVDFATYSSRLLQHQPGDTVKLLIRRQSQEEYREIHFDIVLGSVPR